MGNHSSRKKQQTKAPDVATNGNNNTQSVSAVADPQNVVIEPESELPCFLWFMPLWQNLFGIIVYEEIK